MVREILSYTTTGILSFALLGVIGLVMAKQTFKESGFGLSEKQ